MEKIYVNEGCILSLEKCNNVYVLIRENNGNSETLFQSENETIVRKLMISIANENKDNGEIQTKNDINKILNTNELEKNLLFGNKKQKSVLKYNSVKERINNKKKIAKIPEDIKADLMKFNITENSLLQMVEEANKKNIDFYEYLKATLNEYKDKQGKEELSKKMNILEAGNNRKTLSSIRKTSVINYVTSEEIGNYALPYCVQVDNKIGYMLANDTETKRLIIIKEILVNEKGKTKDEMFKFEVKQVEKYTENTFKEIYETMEELVDEFIKEDDDIKLQEKEECNSIGSIDDYFMKNMNGLDDIMNAYKSEISKHADRTDMSSMVTATTLTIGDLTLEILLPSNAPKIDINKLEERGNCSSQFAINGKNVEIGYHHYNDSSNNNYYAAFVKENNNEEQIIYTTTSEADVEELVDKLVKILTQL